MDTYNLLYRKIYKGIPNIFSIQKDLYILTSIFCIESDCTQEDLNGFSKVRKDRAVEVLNSRVPEKVNDTTYIIPSADGSTQYKVKHRVAKFDKT